jgi:hypothetical protein
MGQGNYKSIVEGSEYDTFNVGPSSDPAKFSKLLKNIKTYSQKTYKSPDDTMKALQQLARPKLDYPTKPTKGEYMDKTAIII